MPAESGDIAVLCVEADPERADRTVRLLEAATPELSVTAVSTAQDGLARLETDAVDCILSTYSLLEVDGLQFLQAVRAEYPNLPFVLSTATVPENVVSAAVSADVSDHLDKPQQPSGYQDLADRLSVSSNANSSTRTPPQSTCSGLTRWTCSVATRRHYSIRPRRCGRPTRPGRPPVGLNSNPIFINRAAE